MTTNSDDIRYENIYNMTYPIPTFNMTPEVIVVNIQPERKYKSNKNKTYCSSLQYIYEDGTVDNVYRVYIDNNINYVVCKTCGCIRCFHNKN